MYEPQAMTEMPRYRCHKEVWALKIKTVVAEQEPQFSGALCRSIEGCGDCERCIYRAHHGYPGYIMTPDNPSYSPIKLDRAYFNKHHPQDGGYYVVYKDGYKSFSPADAFEDGYTKI